jgi:ankyrin repeat protein
MHVTNKTSPLTSSTLTDLARRETEPNNQASASVPNRVAVPNRTPRPDGSNLDQRSIRIQQDKVRLSSDIVVNIIKKFKEEHDLELLKDLIVMYGIKYLVAEDNKGNSLVKLLIEHAQQNPAKKAKVDQILQLELKKSGVNICHFAAHYGYENIIELMLNYDKSLFSKQDANKNNPLLYAINGHYIEIAKMISQQCGKEVIDQHDSSGNNALSLVIGTDSYNIEEANDLFKYLLFCGADPNVKCANQEYIIYELFALQKIDIEKIKMLLDFNFNFLKLTNKQGKSFLQVIENRCRQDGVADTEIKSLLNHRIDNDKNMLHCAIDKNNLEIVTYLLRLGANPDIPDKHGNTALDTALAQNNREMLAILRDFNAVSYVTEKNKKLGINCGYLARITAEFKETHNLESLIVRLGEDRRIKYLVAEDNKGNSLVKLLIEHAQQNPAKKAKVDQILQLELKKSGVNICHFAAHYGYENIIELMLNYDKSLFSKQDANKNNPLLYAINGHYIEIAKMISQQCGKEVIDQHDSSGNNALSLVIGTDSYNIEEANDLFKYLLFCGADPNVKCANQEYIIYELFALQKIDIEKIKMLLDFNFNFLKLTNKQGKLLPEVIEKYCNQCGVTDITPLLNHKINNDKTMLHYAVAQNNLNIVTCLLYSGADPNITDKHDNTAVDIALMQNNRDIFKSLKLFNGESLTYEKNRQLGIICHALPSIITNFNESSYDLESLFVWLEVGDHMKYLVAEYNGNSLVKLLIEYAQQNPDQKAKVDQILQMEFEDTDMLEETGMNICHIAAKYDYKNIIEQMLNYDKSLFSKQDDYKNNPLLSAIVSHNIEIAKLIAKQCGKEVINQHGCDNNAFRLVISTGSYRIEEADDLFEYLLSCGADPHIKEDQQDPIIYEFFKSPNIDVVKIKMLLDFNFNFLETTNKQGKTLPEIMKEHCDQHGIHNEINLVLNHRINNDKTMLHDAVAQNNLEFVTKLLLLGASPNIPDTHGKRALDIVLEKENTAVAIILTNFAAVEGRVILEANDFIDTHINTSYSNMLFWASNALNEIKKDDIKKFLDNPKQFTKATYHIYGRARKQYKYLDTEEFASFDIAKQEELLAILLQAHKQSNASLIMRDEGIIYKIEKLSEISQRSRLKGDYMFKLTPTKHKVFQSRLSISIRNEEGYKKLIALAMRLIDKSKDSKSPLYAIISDIKIRGPATTNKSSETAVLYLDSSKVTEESKKLIVAELATLDPFAGLLPWGMKPVAACAAYGEIPKDTLSISSSFGIHRTSVIHDAIIAFHQGKYRDLNQALIATYSKYQLNPKDPAIRLKFN